MPHIPIIIDTIEVLEQIDGYHETITDNITAEMYEGKQLEDAQALLTGTETLLADQKTALDAAAASLQAFIG